MTFFLFQYEMDAVKDGCKYILDKVKIEDLKRFLSVNREENKDG